MTLDEIDADLLESLTDGLEVLQVGCHQGFDTAVIARSAVRVVTIGQRAGMEHAGFRSSVAMWMVIQRFYHTADHTLMIHDDPAAILTAFTPGQFDVAIVDFSAFPQGLPFNLFPLVNSVAHKVIINAVPGTSLAEWSAALMKMGYIAEQAGNLWVMDPAPRGAAIESEVEV